MRDSLEWLLKAAGYGVEVFASGEAFLQRNRYDGAACLILDVNMPGLNGFDLLGTLSGTDCPLPIIFITGFGDIPMSVRAMKLGAVDFLSKPFEESELLGAVERALAESKRVREWRDESADLRVRLASLTRREYEVLTHVIAGRLNKQIAADLGVIEQTVKIHRSRVMKKMQVQSVAELVRITQSSIEPRPR